MRKALLAATVAIATMTSAVTAADISLGIDGTFGISSKKENTKPKSTDETFETTKHADMYTMLRVGIRASEVLEISPYFGIGFDNLKEIEKEDLETGDGLKEYENTTKQVQLGAGVGAFFHVINKDWFELSTGPRFNWKMKTAPKNTDDRVKDFKDVEYDTYKDHTIGLDVPLNLDFLVGDAFGFRVSTELLNFNINNVTSEVKDEDVEYKDTNINFSVLGMAINDSYMNNMRLPINVGVFFRF